MNPHQGDALDPRRKSAVVSLEPIPPLYVIIVHTCILIM